MNAAGVVYALARADFLERVRRYSFLLTLLFAIFLGYGAATGRITVRLEDYRGVYNSAWIGGLAALVTTLFVSLVGFYIVKGSVDRDRTTGVGQILAATPLTKPVYASGKFLSNFSVLTAMVAVLAICALVMQAFVSEDAHVQLFHLLSPFVLIALPAMALTAAIAVLFEMLPVLRGGVGNVVWFFAWVLGGLTLPDVSKNDGLDPLGFMTVAHSMQDAARLVIPGYKNSFSLTIEPPRSHALSTLRWEGVHWSAEGVGLRVMWVLVAMAIVMLAAIFFDRFDARSWRFSFRGRGTKNHGEASAENARLMNGMEPASANGAALNNFAVAGFTAAGARLHLTALPGAARSKEIDGAFGRLLIAELRLALQGMPWWWYLVAAGFLIAEFTAPLQAVRGPVLGTAWVWPVLIWSAMGSRESRFATRGLLFACSGILTRQLPASFLAGVAVAMLAGAGIGARLALANDFPGVLAWFAGALFIPALALGLGVISGSGKPFEALLTALWYVGPLNHTAGMDFTGAASGAATMHYALVYFALSAALLAAAFFFRARQLRNN
jgi:hypothetical protein